MNPDYSKKPKSISFNVCGNIVHVDDRWMVTIGPASKYKNVLRVHDMRNTHTSVLPRFHREIICDDFLHLFENTLIVLGNALLTPDQKTIELHDLQSTAPLAGTPAIGYSVLPSIALKNSDGTLPRRECVQFYNSMYIVKIFNRLELYKMTPQEPAASRMNRAGVAVASIELPELYHGLEFYAAPTRDPWIKMVADDQRIILSRKTVDGTTLFLYNYVTMTSATFACAMLDNTYMYHLILNQDFVYVSNIHKTLRVNVNNGEYAVVVNDKPNVLITAILIPGTLEIVDVDANTRKNYTFNVETGVVQHFSIPLFMNNVRFVNAGRAIRGRSILQF